MFGSGSSIIARTLKTALALAIIGYLAAAALSQNFDRDALARLAAGSERPVPLTTGSIPEIVPGLGNSRIDPCVMPDR